MWVGKACLKMNQYPTAISILAVQVWQEKVAAIWALKHRVHNNAAILNALLSLQTKDNRFRASDLQQHFNWRDFAGNAEEQKWIRFGIGYLIFLCGQYILHCSHVINLFEHVYLFSRRICLVSCWSSDIKSINGKYFFACQNIQKLSMFKSRTTTDFLLERVN